MLEAGDAYPSGFVRGLIYSDWFRRHGYHAKFVSRLVPSIRRICSAPPAYVAPVLAAGGRVVLRAFEESLARIREVTLVRMAREYDVVYLSKVTSYRLVHRLRQKTRARIVMDFGDALWLPGRGSERFDDMLRLADAITTDNEMTAAYVRQLQLGCTVIFDSPQIEWFDRERKERARGDERIVIGWVGTPGTTYNLYVVWEALERLFSRHYNLHLRMIGANPRALPPFERVRWSFKPAYSQAEMIQEVLRMDIGLFPLQDVEACRVRGVLKATIYMAGGACVIASPVGQTSELIEHGVTGLLAATSREWSDGLERLVSDPNARQRLADNGLALVRSRFTVDRAFERLREVLDPPGVERDH